MKFRAHKTKFFWGENSHEKCLGQKKVVLWFSFFTIPNFWQTTPLRRRRITGRVMNRTKGKRVKPHLKSTRDIFFYTCIILICVDHTLFIIRCSSSFIHFFAIFSFFILRPQLELNVYIAKNYPVQIRDSLFWEQPNMPPSMPSKHRKKISCLSKPVFTQNLRALPLCPSRKEPLSK